MEQKNNKNVKKWEFRESEVAKNLKTTAETYSDYFNMVDEINKQNKESENGNMFIIDKNIVKHSFIKICDIWNKDEKARKFLKHLISAFIQSTSWDKMLNFSEDTIKENKNVCAIMGFKLAGIRDIAEKFSSFILDRAQIGVAENEEEKQKAIDAYNEKLNALPLEIRLRRIAYCNLDESDKYLSSEAFLALIKIFVPEMLLHGDRDMEWFLTNLRRKKMGYPKYNKKPNYKKNPFNDNKVYHKKQESKESEKIQNSIGNMISEDSINKLKSLK